MKIVADENIPFVVECFSSIGEVVTVSGREITPKAVADTDVLLVRSITPVNKDLLAASKVKFVGTATIGFEHVDVDYLKDNDIGFASAPGSNANSAAEYVITALLEIRQRHNINLQGKSIGIIGVGNVGSRMAKKCAALAMNTYLNDPPLQRQTRNSKYLPIENLYDCDFITFHTPLTFEGVDKTFHLADEKFFKSLRPGCIFINTSRGGVVDSGALKETIRTGKLKAVILDVWEDEPNIDTELLQMVDIGTPHIAGYSLDGKIAGMIMIYKAVCEHFVLEAKLDIEDFLPEPSVPQIKIELASGSEQEVLLNAVRQIYDIREDDTKLRQILSESTETKGKFFDSLRKNYSVRREFQNTQIILATGNLSEKLKGIGFKIANSQGV